MKLVLLGLLMNGCSSPEQHFNSEIVIAAEPDLVWSSLTNKQDNQQWKPWFSQLDGELKQGTEILISYSDSANQSEDIVAYTATVVKLLPKQQLVLEYQASTFINARYQINIHRLPDGSSQFIQQNTLSGLGVVFTESTQLSDKLASTSVALKKFTEQKAYMICLDQKYLAYLDIEIAWIKKKSDLVSNLLPKYSDLIVKQNEIASRLIEQKRLAYLWFKKNMPHRIYTSKTLDKWLNIGPVADVQISASDNEYSDLLDKIRIDRKTPPPKRGAWMIREERETVWPTNEYKALFKQHALLLEATNMKNCTQPKHFNA
ncbi:hypothetical protein [Pelagibaculum spongiae]|uniref:hypothetical protein n=1 Tax=Pelagibaculum spongiae TaxID=2080658 RepID=UPI0010581319|nr:hypothetical protein [Pelagibaculum spongiae]